MTLPECIVCEIRLDRRKYFFVVVYRSPSQDKGQFDNFMINFELMLSKMHAENPYCVTITGDFNCSSVSNITLPPYTRKIWFYDKADFVKIVKSIEMFRWQEHLQKIACPNEQVKLLNEVLLSTYSNFVPN